MTATTEQIRAHFPALNRMHNGHPVAYFDGPGGTQVPRAVAEAMTDYLFAHNANTHWSYPSSAETDAMLFGAREAAADFLGATPREIVFGANMTTLTFHLSRTLGRVFQAGDEIVITELDHHANIAPWRALEREHGMVIRVARVNAERGQLDYGHLASLVGERTRLIAVGGASNAIGTVNKLEDVAAVAKAAGSLLFVDAVHLAPHELVDVRKIGCDFLACSSYKFYGPHAGILYVRQELLESLPFPKLAPSPDTAPDRAETGTQNHEAIAGIGATIDFLASLGGENGTRRERLAATYAAFHERGLELVRALWSGLSAVDGVRLYGADAEQARTPTVAFTVEGVGAEDVVIALAERAIFASHGDFYASTIVERLQCGELVRVGCAAYTTADEVGRLIDGVREIAARG